MPTIDRSIYDVVKFTPQASVSKNGGISFAGSNNRYNSFQVDGAVANDSFGLAASGTNGGQTGANPISLDAIEEIESNRLDDIVPNHSLAVVSLVWRTYYRS